MCNSIKTVAQKFQFWRENTLKKYQAQTLRPLFFPFLVSASSNQDPFSRQGKERKGWRASVISVPLKERESFHNDKYYIHLSEHPVTFFFLFRDALRDASGTSWSVLPGWFCLFLSLMSKVLSEQPNDLPFGGREGAGSNFQLCYLLPVSSTRIWAPGWALSL